MCTGPVLGLVCVLKLRQSFDFCVASFVCVLSFVMVLCAIEFLRNSAIQVKFIIFIIILSFVYCKFCSVLLVFYKVFILCIALVGHRIKATVGQTRKKNSLREEKKPNQKMIFLPDFCHTNALGFVNRERLERPLGDSNGRQRIRKWKLCSHIYWLSLRQNSHFLTPLKSGTTF